MKEHEERFQIERPTSPLDKALMVEKRKKTQFNINQRTVLLNIKPFHDLMSVNSMGDQAHKLLDITMRASTRE